jgi:hypothetical protein
MPDRNVDMSKVVGVFVRADHPLGWGYVQPGDTYGRAHGYVTLFVRCADEAELEAVSRRLGIKPFLGIEGVRTYFNGMLAEWFGGRFECIATVPDVELYQVPPGTRFICRGDNRMVAIYEASEVLDAH